MAMDRTAENYQFVKIDFVYDGHGSNNQSTCSASFKGNKVWLPLID